MSSGRSRLHCLPHAVDCDKPSNHIHHAHASLDLIVYRREPAGSFNALLNNSNPGLHCLQSNESSKVEDLVHLDCQLYVFPSCNKRDANPVAWFTVARLYRACPLKVAQGFLPMLVPPL